MPHPKIEVPLRTIGRKPDDFCVCLVSHPGRDFNDVFPDSRLLGAEVARVVRRVEPVTVAPDTIGNDEVVHAATASVSDFSSAVSPVLSQTLPRM